ncbi:MAG: RNA polymerase sigma factor [Planctomycetota bacterium]
MARTRKTAQPGSAPAAAQPAVEGVEGEEANLIVRYRNGDREAFDELWARYASAVFNFVVRLVGNAADAEEVVQETFLRIHRAAAGYKPKAKALTWILQISRNLCLDHFKRQSLRQHQSLNIVTGDETSGGTLGDLLPDSEAVAPHQSMLATEDRELLQQGIARLSEKKREALVLRLWHELPYEEIAVIVDAPSGTVKYRVHEAIKDLREMLEKTSNFRP